MNGGRAYNCVRDGVDSRLRVGEYGNSRGESFSHDEEACFRDSMEFSLEDRWGCPKRE